MHFTYEGDSVTVDGREFRFSRELGRRVGASEDGFIVTSKTQVPHHGSQRGPWGYYGVTSGNHSVYDHKLVYELFSGPVPDGMQIDHINTDPHDNRLCNLRVVTPAENMRNPITRQRNLKQLGSVQYMAANRRKRHIYIIWNGCDEPLEMWCESVTKAAEFTGLDRSTIAKMCDGRLDDSRGGGFTFRYDDTEEEF